MHDVNNEHDFQVLNFDPVNEESDYSEENTCEN